MRTNYKLSNLVILVLILNSCATLKLQVDEAAVTAFPEEKEIEHSFYFLGDGGNSPIGDNTSAIKDFQIALDKASKNSTAIFLGDNVYDTGFPEKKNNDRALAEHRLQVQIDAAKNFKGNTIFIPGNHDWYSGLEGLKRQEKFVEDALGKNTFLPENGCPIEKIDIADDIVLIVVDAHWYIMDWDKHPKINDDCEIKTREKFFDELESQIKKARGKTTLIALHHPLFTNGSHGGQYSFASHLKPLPVLGTLKNLLRETSGVANVDVQNKLYRTFRKRVITLAQENDKAIFVSGHDHSLQYIVQDNLPQIVSGSGSKVSATRNVGGGQFSYGSNGYTRLDVFKDGSSHVQFYSSEDKAIVFQTEVHSENIEKENVNFKTNKASKVSASIYSEEEVTKSNFYKTLWGERYRKYFGINVEAPTVDLDTLFGGLTAVRKGGGHQSMSLRLKDKDGREYVMRALRKNALQYLQAVAFKDQYIEGQFNETLTQDLLLDVFTGAHPYAPFAIGTLSDAVGVYHTNPVLYYVPKQEAIGEFNDEFGDALYMIEERAADGHGDKASFGFSDKLISTDDLLKQLSKNQDHILDEEAYIKARLFDMLIGDWDRHEDQWRWAKFKEKGKTIYRPVPRDRDQAFSIMADGFVLGVATKIVPGLRLMQSYDEELKSPKWFNLEPFPLDIALINQSDRTVWETQVNYIIGHLTDEVIDEAFAYIPDEVNDATIDDIKRKLKGRRANLQKISDMYYKHINEFSLITGTNKDDWFEIERMPEGDTKVTGYRIKNGKKGEIFHQRIYTCEDTKEVWIYGLDDDDTFTVFGEGDKMVCLRLVGGQNKDTYDIQNGKLVKVYDYKSKKSEFVTKKGDIKLTDNYDTNTYDYKKLKNSSNQFVPSLGANPDDGFKIGFANTYTKYGFERNPFTSQHTISGAYYFATQGFDLGYKGEFANIVGEANLGIKAHFNSPNYAVNFFGFGNETPNPEADEDDGLDVNLNFNRVKIRTVKIAPSLIWRGRLGSSVEIGVSYESNEVERTSGRFLETVLSETNEVFDKQDFYGIDAKYQFSNADNEAYPTLGMHVEIQTGYKNNVSTSKGFGYIIPELGFDYKLEQSGQLVLATKAKAQINLGDDFEFYQASTIGANEGLRGYRNERFTGKNAFVQSTDLRLNLRKVKTGLLPLNIGIYGGFDYGRVWLENDQSKEWNTSIGGGIFANAADIATLNLSAFSSDDGLRLAFKLGFGF
jgi:hypothetical protein